MNLPPETNHNARPGGHEGRKVRTMKEVKYYVHSESPYITPHYMALSQLPAELAEMQKLAHEAMTKAGTAHAVYAVKKYTATDEIEKVDFYNPPVCLNDADFYERTQAEAKKHPGCMIYAVHAQKTA